MTNRQCQQRLEIDRIIDDLPADRLVLISLWLKWWRMWILSRRGFQKSRLLWGCRHKSVRERYKCRCRGFSGFGNKRNKDGNPSLTGPVPRRFRYELRWTKPRLTARMLSIHNFHCYTPAFLLYAHPSNFRRFTLSFLGNIESGSGDSYDEMPNLEGSCANLFLSI